jgi:hypothetical protein
VLRLDCITAALALVVVPAAPTPGATFWPETDSSRKPSAATSRTPSKTIATPLLSGVCCEAADGIRTHDILHGKQFVRRRFVKKMPANGGSRHVARHGVPGIHREITRVWVSNGYPSRRLAGSRPEPHHSESCTAVKGAGGARAPKVANLLQANVRRSSELPGGSAVHALVDPWWTRPRRAYALAAGPSICVPTLRVTGYFVLLEGAACVRLELCVWAWLGPIRQGCRESDDRRQGRWRTGCLMLARSARRSSRGCARTSMTRRRCCSRRATPRSRPPSPNVL